MGCNVSGNSTLRVGVAFKFGRGREIPTPAKAVVIPIVAGPEVRFSVNQKLSSARAADVKKIILKSLEQSRRNDVTFKVYSFGENQDLTPFFDLKNPTIS